MAIRDLLVRLLDSGEVRANEPQYWNPRPDGKGLAEERQVASALYSINGVHLVRSIADLQRVPPGACVLLNDLTLRNTRTVTTQVDHILVTPFAVLVIETKGWSGWIFGQPGDHNWTQRFANGATYQHLNPLKQNAPHCFAVVEAIGKAPLVPIVVLAGDGIAKTDLGPNTFESIKDLRSYVAEVTARPGRLRPVDVANALLKAEATVEQAEGHIDRIKERYGPTVRTDSSAAIIDALDVRLRKLRTSLAKQHRVPPFVVMDNKTLTAIAERCPQTKEDLLAIPGIGQARLDQYGNDLLSTIADHLQTV